jgi:hypothetical protein
MSGSLGYEMEKQNRINKRKPKKKLVWCNCDRNKINPGGKKCELCGKKIGRSRNKREPYIED